MSTPVSRGDSASSQGMPRRVDSRTLLGPEGRLVITHGDRRYELKLTKNGKLILNA